MSANEGYQKIIFRLERDSDGYPPADRERVWAESLGEGKYRIDNIPFFTYGISCDDIVEAELVDGEMLFKQVLQPSGHTKVRVYVFNPNDVATIRNEFKAFGCESEGSRLPKLFSLDIPASVEYSKIRAELERGSAEKRWEYEEANLRHGY